MRETILDYTNKISNLGQISFIIQRLTISLQRYSSSLLALYNFPILCFQSSFIRTLTCLEMLDF
jgi:hypothetical protein